jgi:peptidoglycan/LPS O-acetylase OafA/YrhL
MRITAMLKHPSAFMPLVMSLAALAVVVGYLVVLGPNAPPQPDEGAAAHLWQLLMGGQLPIVAFFALKWLPRAPKEAFPVLALQFVAGVAAAAPVFLLEM